MEQTVCAIHTLFLLDLLRVHIVRSTKNHLLRIHIVQITKNQYLCRGKDLQTHTKIL